MTTYTPPAEAVEAAAAAIERDLRARTAPPDRFSGQGGLGLTCEQIATAALTAAGPIIAAEALRGSGKGQSCGCAWCCSQNAASVIPGKGHEICPAQRGRRILRGEVRDD